jgi:hypothetical protein
MHARFAWGLFHASQNILRELKKTQGILSVVEQTTVSVSAISPTKHRQTEGSGGTNDGPNEQESRTDVADEAPLLTDGDQSSDDAAPESPLDVSAWTERDLEVAEGLDADLHVRRPGELQ